MAWPLGLPRGSVNFGAAVVAQSGQPLAMRVTIDVILASDAASKVLVFRPTGQPLVGITTVFDSDDSTDTHTMELPLCDTTSMGYGNGFVISLDQTHRFTHVYRATIDYLSEDRKTTYTALRTVKSFVLTTDAPTGDIDDLVLIPDSVAQFGLPVSIPNSWGANIDAAAASAQEAAASAFEARQSADYTASQVDDAEAFAVEKANAAVTAQDIPGKINIAVASQDIPGKVRDEVAAQPTVVDAARIAAQAAAAGLDFLIGTDPRAMKILGSTVALADGTVPVFVVSDPNRRVSLAQFADGSWTIYKQNFRPLSIPASALAADVPLPKIINSAEAIFAITDIVGRKALWITPEGYLDTTKVGPNFTASIISIINANGGGPATQYKPGYGVNPTVGQIVSGPNAALVGHSMLAQAASAISTALTGITVTSLAVGGENSRAIFARQGGQPATFLPVSGNIAASGTATPITLGYADGGASWPLLQGLSTYTGYLMLPSGVKVPGSFSVIRDPSAVVNVHHPGDVYQFTQSGGGGAVACARPAAFYYDAADARRDDIMVYWPGRNNIIETDQVVGDLAAGILHQRPLKPRFVVLSDHNTSAETVGTANYNSMLALNAKYRLLYGRRFIDTRRYLITYGLADAGITPTTQDTTDIANDVVPTSLRGSGDSLHLNAAGSAIVAALVKARLQELGWYA